MAIYYLSLKTKKDNRINEIHKSNCPYLPKSGKRKHLGDFLSCKTALREAEKYVENSNGCCYCSRLCNSSC